MNTPPKNAPLAELIPLLGIIFIDSFSYFVVIPIFLEIFYQSQYGLFQQGLSPLWRNILTETLLVLPLLTALITAPLVGALSDRIGRKPVLLSCLLCMIAGFSFLILGIHKAEIGWLFIGRLLSGIGTTSQPIAQAITIDITSKNQKAKRLSWIALTMTLAFTLAPLLGGYLSDKSLTQWFGPLTPCWFSLALSSINLLLLLRLTETHPAKTKLSLKVLDPSKWLELYSKKALASYALLKQKNTQAILIIFTLLEVSWSQYYQIIFIYLSQHQHLSTQQISLFNTYLGSLMAAGLLGLYPILLRFFSLKAISTLSILLVAVGLLACTWQATQSAQWLFSPLVTVFTGTAYVSLLALLSDNTAIEKQGATLGLASSLLFFAWILTGLTGGIFYSIHPKAPLWIGVIAISTALFMTKSLRGNVDIFSKTRTDKAHFDPR